MKMLLQLLFASIGLFSASHAEDAKIFEFYDAEGLKYSYLYHIEVKDGKVTGDITTRELADDDPEFQQMVKDGKAKLAQPIDSSSFTGDMKGLKLTISFDDNPTYDLPHAEKGGKTTKWQIQRTPNGMILKVPRSGWTGDFDKDKNRIYEDYVADVPEMKSAIKNHGAEQQPNSTPSAPAPASQPSNVTIEPLYTWDVKVWVGRKYSMTNDTYESSYTSVNTEVKAKTRSEAERIAVSQSYTARSAFLSAAINVEPAGTLGAKFRCTSAEATRQ